MMGHGFSGVVTARGVYAAIFATLFAVPMLVDCGGQATCEDLCDNFLDKCSGDFGTSAEYEDVARNNCLEECAQRSNLVPASCDLEKQDLLNCLADAESLDCSDAQQSASCATENAAVNECVFGTSNNGGNTGSGGSTGNGGSANGESCESDNDCASDLCSWVDDTCTVPAPIGEACERDDECIDELCNWATDLCAEPGGPGAPCGRDDECLSGSCPDDACD